MGKIALLASGAAGLGAIAVTLKAGVSEWVQSAKVAAQTGAVLESTGKAANVTAKEVDTLATALMNKSGIDDEVIKTGENMLLTFTGIHNEVGKGNDIFNQATTAITDMDVAMTHGNTTQESLSKTAILVGKALNDPIKGATALRRVGVQLTDQQTAQIAAFVKSGDTMKAQKIILAELTKEFGGSAKAMGDTMPGAINKLKENFNNLAGSIVGGLMPAFSTAISGLNTFVKRLSEAKGFTAKIGVVFDVAKDAFTAVRKSIERLLFGGSSGAAGAGFGGMTVKIDTGVVSKIRDAFAKLNWTSVGKSIIDGITNALKSAGNLAKQLAGTITKAIRAIDWNTVGRIMGPGLAAAIVAAFATLLDPAFWAKNWDLALAIGLTVFGGAVGKIAGKLAAPFARLGGDLVLSLAGAIERASPRLAEAVLVGLQKLPGLIGALFGRIGSTLEGLVRSLFGRLGAVAVFTIKVLGIDIAINTLVGFATGPVWNTIRTAFTSIATTATTAWTAVTSAITTAGTAILSAVTTVWNTVKALILRILTEIGTDVRTWATTTMPGLLRAGGAAMLAGLATAWNAISGLASRTFNGIVTSIRGIMGSAVGAASAVGKATMSGLWDGLKEIWQHVTGWLSSLPGFFRSLVGGAGSWLIDAGKRVMQGFLDGLKAGWQKVTDFVSGIGGWVADHKGPPAKDAVLLYPHGKLIIQGLGKGMTDGLKLLGVGLTRAVLASFKPMESAALKGMNDVGRLIVAAAKKYGVDARAALAVAMGEGGIKFGAVGDSGHAFGPFQFNNAGGVATGKSAAEASAWANSARGVADAIRMMADAGARGKTGLDAITAIVRNFERPLDPSGSIRKAAEAYRTLGPQIGAAIKSGAGAVTTSQRTILTGLVNLAKQYGPTIGIEQVRGIIRGLDASKPGFLAAASKAMAEAQTAMRTKILEGAATVGDAFGQMADRALAKFDEKVAAWKNPLTAKLTAAQNASDLQGAGAGIGKAFEDIMGGSALDAENKGKDIGTTIATAMSTAMSQIMKTQMTGNLAKDTANLGRVAAAAQASVAGQITAAAQPAIDQANNQVAIAQAALTAAQASGDQEAITKANQDLTDAVGRRNALETAVQGAITTATGQLATQVDKRHETIAAHDRAGLSKQLTQTGEYLAKHPALWAKMGVEVNKTLAKFNINLQAAGKTWAEKFAIGITSGKGFVTRAVQDLVNAALAQVHQSPPKEGPLAGGTVDKAGKLLAKEYAGGIRAASGLVSSAMTAMLGGGFGGGFSGGVPIRGGTLAMAGAPAGGGLTVNVFNAGSVITENELQESIYRSLERRAGRNGGR